MKLRVLALGTKNANRRVANSLDGSGIEVICKTDAFEALNLLKTEKFDLALIDGYMDDLESTCYRISWLYRTPIALIIKGTEDDWDKLRNLDVDGFIPEEAKNIGVTDYFQTICRRGVHRFDKIKVLIIEDDEQIRETLRLTFEVYWPEAEISFAFNGKEGIRKARSESADLILLDLKLPDIFGLDLLDQIRSFSQTPVVILTADRNQDNIMRAIRSGANDYVLKPFKQSELIARIRQFTNIKETLAKV